MFAKMLRSLGLNLVDEYRLCHPHTILSWDSSSLHSIHASFPSSHTHVFLVTLNSAMLFFPSQLETFNPAHWTPRIKTPRIKTPRIKAAMQPTFFWVFVFFEKAYQFDKMQNIQTLLSFTEYVTPHALSLTDLRIS